MHSTEVIYEVSLSVPRAREKEFLAWLRPHIRELLSLPGFVDASLWRVDNPHPAWAVRYRLENREELEAYFARHASRMRADGLRRFGEDLSATRRILTLEETFIF